MELSLVGSLSGCMATWAPSIDLSARRQSPRRFPLVYPLHAMENSLQRIFSHLFTTRSHVSVCPEARTGAAIGRAGSTHRPVTSLWEHIFMAQPLRSVRCFMASYHGFLASYHGIPIRLNSRHKKSKACSWSVKLSGCYAAKGTLLQRCVMSVIEGLLPA